MDEHERIDRETLLKWAAGVAGSVYVAPILTASAGASTHGPHCARQACTPGRRGDRQCRILGGKGCACIGGQCRFPATGKR